MLVVGLQRSKMQYEYSAHYRHRGGFITLDYWNNLDNFFVIINEDCIDDEVTIKNERTGNTKTFPVPCFNPEPF